MKETLKNIICIMPIHIKNIIADMLSLFNLKKKKILKDLKNNFEYNDEKFKNINELEYKKNLANCINKMICPVKDIKNFITYLYLDKIEITNEVELDYKNPTIICVVKNEYDKLLNFFEHYNKLGKINYIFIDNDSTDGTIELLKENNAKIYSVKEKFLTIRKLAWINKIYSTIPENSWTLLLDADELLVYYEYESKCLNELTEAFEKNNIEIAGAVMLDMFSKHSCSRNDYIKEYKFFQNSFEEKKSYWYNSIYGGIREREFNFLKERIFLIKKHPLVKKKKENILISCHYIYPFEKNLKAATYLALLHYKLFDNEIQKYKKIAEDGSYGKGGGSKEYKLYLSKFAQKKYEDIFKTDENTLEFNGTETLKKISILKNNIN